MNHPFLLIGGTGTVGGLTAQHLRAFHPGFPLAIGSRTEEKAREHAAKLGQSIGVAIDSNRSGLGLDKGLKLSGIAVVAGIRTTHAVAYAAHEGIPYTSIATQFNEMGPKLAYHINNQALSASLIQDTNYAGVVIVAGLEVCSAFSSIERLDVGVVMDDQDMGGESSVADAGDFEAKEPGVVLVNGRWKLPSESEKRREFELLDGSRYQGESFPSIDAAELAERTGAQWVRLDFAFGETRGRRLHGVPSADVVYDVTGTLKDGRRVFRRAQLSHAKGQTWLTSAGLAVGIEALVGLGGLEAARPGVHLTSGLIPPSHMMRRLKELGATLKHHDTVLAEGQ